MGGGGWVEPRGGAGLPVPRAPRRAHERALERGRRGAALRIVRELLLDGNPLVPHRELRRVGARGKVGLVVYSQDASPGPADEGRGRKPARSGGLRAINAAKSAGTSHLVRVMNAVVARRAQVRSCRSRRGARSAGEGRGKAGQEPRKGPHVRKSGQMSRDAGKVSHRRGDRTTPRARCDSSRTSRGCVTCLQIRIRRVRASPVRRPRRYL